MDLKKTRFCGRYAVIFGICSIAVGLAMFVLTLSGVIHKQTENNDFGQGIAYAFAIVFFVIYMIIQAFISLYGIIFGAIVSRSAVNGKSSRPLLIVSAIVESVFAVVCGINVFLIFGFRFIPGGVFCLVCTLSGIFTVVLCAIAAKENKKCFIKG